MKKENKIRLVLFIAGNALGWGGLWLGGYLMPKLNNTWMEFPSLVTFVVIGFVGLFLTLLSITADIIENEKMEVKQ